MDLMKEITQVFPAMEAIMYTAREDEGLQYALQSLGTHYLTKPASRQGLISKICQIVKSNEDFTVTGSGRILLVEDTQSVAEIFRQQFRTLGINSDFAENGSQALEMLQTYDYDMIITDFHMPEMDGAELSSIIHNGKGQLKTGSNTPVIGLSADVSISEKSASSENPFQEYLIKPVTLAQLRRLFIRWGLLRFEEEKLPEHTQTQLPKNKNNHTNGQHIDFYALRHRLGSLDEEAKIMLETFVQTMSPRAIEIQKAYNNKDMDRLADLAHSLRGAALSACTPKLAKMGESLESISEDNYSKGYGLLKEIEAEISHIRETVEKL